MIRCSVPGCRVVLDLVADGNWEGGMCDDHWRRTSRITRGWFALVQRNGEESGWLERYVTEHNLIWDILIAQARDSDRPARRFVPATTVTVDLRGKRRRR